MKLRLDIELTSAEEQRWDRIAIMEGFERTDPRKAWTAAERKEAIRWAMKRSLLQR